MIIPAFTSRAGRYYMPTQHAVGPWGNQTLNGRILGGLAARDLEEELGGGGFHGARFTVDLVRPASLDPIAIETCARHVGNRVRVGDAALTQGSRLVALARAVFTAAAPDPGGVVWSPARQPTPVPVFPAVAGASLDIAAYSGDSDQPGTDMAAWGSPVQPSFAWIRENRELVQGEPITPYVRAALAGDVTSPMTNWGTAGLGFINVDYTVNLSRPARGDLIGLGAIEHLHADGVAIGTVTLYDAEGPMGTATTTAIANAQVAFALPSPISP